MNQTFLFVSEMMANNIRQLHLNGTMATLSRGGFNQPQGLCYGSNLFVADKQTNRILRVDSSGSVSVLAGSGIASQVDGFGVYSSFNGPSAVGVTQSGIVFAGDANIIRQLTCVPCPTCWLLLSFELHQRHTLPQRLLLQCWRIQLAFSCPAGTFISATGSTYVSNALAATFVQQAPLHGLVSIAAVATTAPTALALQLPAPSKYPQQADGALCRSKALHSSWKQLVASITASGISRQATAC